MGLIDRFAKQFTRLNADPSGGAAQSFASVSGAVWDMVTFAANQFAAAQARGVIVYKTKADMLSDTLQSVGTAAWVLLDADPNNNASYSWDGVGWRSAFDRLAFALGNGSGFQQVGAGAVLRPLQDKGRDLIHVKDFGARGDGSDDTGSLQRAIDGTPDGGVLFFARTDGAFKTDELHISKSIRIEMNGAKFELKGERLFALTSDIDFCELVGCGGVDVAVGARRESTREFFSDWSMLAQRDYSSINRGARHRTQRLVIERNILNAAKITVVGNHRSMVIARNVASTTAADPYAVPYALMIAPGGNAPDRAYGEFLVADNYWDIWSPGHDESLGQPFDGNYDIVKISRATTGLKLRDNFIRNGNASQLCAQVDVFTGAHFLSSSGNTFVNVQLHRKQMVGAVPTPDFGMDSYVNDQWIVQAGFKVAYATGPQGRNNPIYLHGARSEFIGCKVLNESNAPMSVFVLPAFADAYPGFGVKGTTHITIMGGIYDLRSDVTTNDSAFVHSGASLTDQADQYLKLLGPTVLGGKKLLRSLKEGARFRNCQRGFVTWTEGGGAAVDMDVDFDYPQVAVGNMYDSGTREVGTHDMTDRRSGYVAIMHTDNGVVNVNAQASFRFAGTGSLKRLEGGRIGQKVTVHKVKDDGVVVHGTVKGCIRLVSGSDFGMDATSAIEVELQPDGVWSEVGRVDARRKLGNTAQRPTNFAEGEAFTYFDTSIGKPVFWNAGWWDAAGASV